MTFKTKSIKLITLVLFSQKLFSSQLDYVIAPEIKNDLLSEIIVELASTSDINTILEIGSSSGDGSTASFVEGISKNPKNPKLFCIEFSKPRFAELEKRYKANPSVFCYNVSSVPVKMFPRNKEVENFLTNVSSPLDAYGKKEVLRWLKQDKVYALNSSLDQNGITKIQKEHKIKDFGIVLIDGSEFTGKAELKLVYGAEIIMLDDILTFKNYDNYHQLLLDPHYRLVTENKTLRHGFAVFEKIS